MSAAFKNAKKKLSQSELRKRMNELKNKKSPATKITSPLAKYNDAGQLTCILCKSVVKSETVWTVHINSKQHKENVERAKTQKHSISEQARGEPPAKKLKSILKNGTDTTVIVQNISKPNDQKVTDIKEQVEVLPEGFFDDPKLDAKVRNAEYKDPVQEEWERFQKEIRETDVESSAIIAEDQEEATTERQIDEIDEQINNWSRVLSLDQKKKSIIPMNVQVNNVESETDSEEEGDVSEFFDWRSKNSFI